MQPANRISDLRIRIRSDNFNYYKKVFLIICSIAFFTTNLYFRHNQNYLSTTKPIIYYIYEYFSDDISCHDTTEYFLPSTEDAWFSPPGKSIFFIETSCKGGVDSRQACAIESAARANPDWDVYVIMAGPIKSSSRGRNPFATLNEINNVHFARASPKLFSKGTPLESFFSENILDSSNYKVFHTADILKYLVLYKYGGVYLDLDMIVVKSFDSLPKNFVVKQSNETIASSVLAFEDNGIGDEFTDAAVNELRSLYKPHDWDLNNLAVTDIILNKFCTQVPFANLTAKKCRGIHVLDGKYFFPVNYEDRLKYFDEKNITTNGDEYAHHIWSSRSTKNIVPNDSLYAKLAKRFCPKVSVMYGVHFGLWKDKEEEEEDEEFNETEAQGNVTNDDAVTPS